MKIFKFIKKNYKRLIIQVVSIISAFVIFSVSASADTFDYSIDMPITKPNISDRFIYIEVLYNNGISGEVYLVNSIVDNDYVLAPELFVYAYDNKVVIQDDIGNEFQLIWITSAGNIGSEIGNEANATRVTISSSNIIGVKVYGNATFTSYLTSSISSWNFNYSTDAITKNQLNTIIGLLQGQTQSNNEINSSIQDSTDQILNGGGPRPEVDTNTVDEHNALENQVHTNNETSINDTKVLFNSYNFTDSISNGLLAVTNIFNMFSNVGWFDSILQHSLVYGLIAFILGMSLLIGRILHKK